jgi:hypothetical protein
LRGGIAVARDESAIGRVGILIVSTRGRGGPGEVRIKIRGGTENFLAWSRTPLPAGTTVLITEYLGPRTVDVMEWTDPLDEAPTIPRSTEVPRSGE